MNDLENNENEVVLDGLYGGSVSDVQTGVDEGPSSNFLEISPDDYPGKQAIVLVRFLPNIYAPAQPIASTITYRMTGLDGRRFTYLSEKSLNKRANCFVADTYFGLKGSKDAIVKQRASDIYWKPRDVAAVQIVGCPAKPELVGTIHPIRLKKDIQTKIDALKNASTAEIQNMLVPVNPWKPEEAANPFDLFQAPIFMIKCTWKDAGEGQKYRDWSQSNWTANFTGIVTKVENGRVVETITANPSTDKAEIPALVKKAVEFLKADPMHDLRDYMYKADEETTKKAKAACEALVAGTDTHLKTDEEPASKEPAVNTAQASAALGQETVQEPVQTATQDAEATTDESEADRIANSLLQHA